jgi:hypothetical protein
MSNPYRLLGIILTAAGALSAPVFYFIIGATPLAAVSLSAIILGFTCIVLANARPYISPEACQMLLKTGMENTSALLEELGVSSKAIYLPSSLRNGRSQALIPLTDTGNLQGIREKIPGRMIIRYGTDADAMGIAVTTPGSGNIELLPNKPGPSAADIENALTYILSGVLDIANSASVTLMDSTVKIQVTGAKLNYEDIWYYRCLGSPIASIAASISCEALEKPVRIKEESSDKKGKSTITLEVLS